MAIPTVYAPIKRQDFTLRPVTVHKQFGISSATLIDTSSGYNVVKGVHTSLKTPIGSYKANNDPTNSFDGSYQHIVWQSYNHMYYKSPYNPLATFEHSNRRYTYKFLNYSASVFSVPYFDYGESIRPGSVVVTDTTTFVKLIDDMNGNLYDPTIVTSSFTNSYNVVGYWGFNEEFKRFKYRNGTVSKGTLKYDSRVFEPDDRSGIKNITFDTGVTGSGMHAEFSGDSYIITNDREDFNPDKTQTYTIAFWVQAPASQANEVTQYNTLISKRGVIQHDVYGVNQKYTYNDRIIDAQHISSSIEDSLTDIFPYDIELINSSGGSDAGKIRARRSNGITVSEITSSVSVTDGKYHHIAYMIGTGSTMLYVDGVLQGTDVALQSDNLYNKHSLMFGALNRSGSQGFSGSMDEIRFYDTELSTDQLDTLCDSGSMALYQTAVVGNIFYRQGNIVISSLMPQYNKILDNSWTVNFSGTHTIYQYEVLCRIKKGSFNMTYNPTARKSFKSDLLINDMTGSLLLPYATTIGMYSDDGELVAVAKLGQAIQMRDDVDINILVRWDA